jgi:hypothetical protein
MSPIYFGMIAQEEWFCMARISFELAGKSRVWLKICCDWFNILTDSLDVFNEGI